MVLRYFNHRTTRSRSIQKSADTHPFQIPAQPDPTHPVPQLIGDGTPVSLYALFCSNGEPAEGPPSFLKCLSRGVYKFLERKGTFALGLDCKNDYH